MTANSYDASSFNITSPNLSDNLSPRVQVIYLLCIIRSFICPAISIPVTKRVYQSISSDINNKRIRFAHTGKIRCSGKSQHTTIRLIYQACKSTPICSINSYIIRNIYKSSLCVPDQSACFVCYSSLSIRFKRIYIGLYIFYLNITAVFACSFNIADQTTIIA